MWKVRVFYDGECPLCTREIAWLRKRTGEETVSYISIQDAEFSELSSGLSTESAMQAMHGMLPDGTSIQGVEVFRRIYEVAGFVPLVRLSRLPGIAQVLEVGYRLFAKNRLRLTGRCTPTSCATSDSQKSV